MAKMYEVRVRVISKTGTCRLDHEVGDKWIISQQTPEGICLSAFHTMFPYLRVLMFGGSHPWETDPEVATIACPDAKNPVVFELRRLRK